MLVIALVVLIAGSLLVLGLANLATTNLAGTAGYRGLRTVDYAGNGAVEGAIQQVRYHGPCESFPKSGSLQLASGQYVMVTCQGTPVAATASGTTLTSPSVPFVAADAITHQTVAGGPSGGTARIGGAATIISVSSDGTTATMSKAATTSGTVTIGTQFQRLDTFYACTSTTPISTCGPGTSPAPAVTATVLFSDLEPSAVAGNPPTPVTGYSLDIVSWVVAGANS